MERLARRVHRQWLSAGDAQELLHRIAIACRHIPHANLVEFNHPPFSVSIVLRRTVTFKILALIRPVRRNERQSLVEDQTGITEVAK